MNHYLLIVLPAGENEVSRVYWPLASVEESSEDALDRYVTAKLEGRQRNRDKAERAIRGGILYTRITRPTSWYDDARERGELTPIGKRAKRGR
jgi:hypothetical protein